TSWYKDVKKLEDVVNRDRLKRYICQDNGMFLLEVWYGEKPEIVIPRRIQKIKGFVNQTSKFSTYNIEKTILMEENFQSNNIEIFFNYLQYQPVRFISTSKEIMKDWLSKDAQIRWRPSRQSSIVKPLFSQINTNAQLAGDVPTDSGSNGRPNDELPASCIDT
ncbi:6062_t:CDS:2, partial [Ambispora gerdemannii]